MIEGRIFLTGAGGYVGRRLLETSRDELPDGVVALVRDPQRLPTAVREMPGIDVVTGDLCEPASFAASVEGCRWVVHLAAQTGKARKSVHARTNVEATRHVLDAARDAGVEGVLHVSTIAAAFRDKTGYHYAHTKLEAEQLVGASDLASTILRPTMVFGPGAPVLEGLRSLARAPLGPIGFGAGTVRVQPVFVDDLVAVIRAVLEQRRFRGETIEVGGPETLTIDELLLRLRGAAPDSGARARHVPLRPVRTMLRLLEGPFLPLLPLTAGQLATFANDGTAEPHPFMEPLLPGMRDLAQMLDAESPDEP